ncbi:MAG: isoprenylcysteine carboxylmethyltransferase family protein [Nitrospirae bacterium]|nr:isoprenylcysteine carboxylmethyltransferase family protein [Nitrospirota bacterium]
MPKSPDSIRTAAVFASGLIYWTGVLVQAYRLKQRTGQSANLRPKGLKERLLWLCWLFVIAGWIGQPLIMRSNGKFTFFSAPELLLSDIEKAGGLLLLLLGYAGTIWCYRVLGDSWRVGVNRKERTPLIRTGPYQFVRHPIYAFQMVMLMGVALLLPTPFSLLVLGIHLVCVIVKAIDEELYLVTIHGAAYQEYLSATGRLLPRLPRRAPDKV